MDSQELRYCRALFQVAVSVNSSLEPWRVVAAIPESAAKAMQAKGCSLMLLSPDRRELRHHASFGLSDWYVRKGPVKVDLSMRQTLSGRSVVIPDVATDSRVQYRDQAIREGIVSILSIPLRLWGEVIGIMRVYTAEPREFGTEDIEFAEAIATLGAIALHNANRYEEVRSDFDAVCRYAYGGTLAELRQ